MRSQWPYSLTYSKLRMGPKGLKNIRKACVQPTASTEWARRAHSVLVSLACVHHGQIHYPISNSEGASRANSELVSLLYQYIFTFAHLYIFRFARLFICICAAYKSGWLENTYELSCFFFTIVHLYNCIFVHLHICTLVHLHICTFVHLHICSV